MSGERSDSRPEMKLGGSKDVTVVSKFSFKKLLVCYFAIGPCKVRFPSTLVAWTSRIEALLSGNEPQGGITK